MLRSPIVAASLALAFAGFACGPASQPTAHTHAIDPAILDPTAPPQERAKSAALSAAQTADLASDVSNLVTQGFSLNALSGLPSLPNGSGQLSFQGPANCTSHVAFGGQHVSLDDDCSTPSGRHVHGSLAISFGGGCSPFGLSVEYHLAIESAPGAGDRVLVDGAVNLGLGHREMNLATTLDIRVTDGGHDVAESIAACLILDGHQHLFAMNGHVTTVVDGSTKLDVEVKDLQTQLCEVLPYNGTIEVMDPHNDIKVTFDQATPSERRVTVLVDGSSFVTELPDEHPVRWCSANTPAPMHVSIDYASCGGCSQPPPPPMQPAPSSGGNGGNNGGNGGNTGNGGNNGGNTGGNGGNTGGNGGNTGGTGGTGGPGGNGV